jgi:hypothetical protein
LSSQATAFESLRNHFLAEIKASHSGTALTSAPFGSSSATLAKFQHKASHNQRLEELRNLQDRLSKEKAEWSRERTMQEEHISEQRKQINVLNLYLNRPTLNGCGSECPNSSVP